MAKQASFLPAPYPCRSLSKYKMVSKKPSLSEKAPVFIRIHHLIHKISINFPNNQGGPIPLPNKTSPAVLSARLRDSDDDTADAGAKNGDCLLPRGTMPEHGLRA